MLTFLGSLGAIILVDLALSGDNALVIGAAASGLPRRQRLLAILSGGGAAIVLRVVFAAAATMLLTLPLLEAIGGVVLLIIAARLLMERQTKATPEKPIEGATSEAKEPAFFQAMLTILIADVTMSLDNILAVGGLAHGDLELLAIGLFISIALLMVGSAVVAELIGRLPVLLDLAALTLGWTAGSMVLHDHIVGPYLQSVPHADILIPAAGVALVLVFDIALRLRERNRRRAQRPEASDQQAESASETTSAP